MQGKSFPCIIIHAGDCGHIASTVFGPEDLSDPARWNVITENLRKHLLFLEDDYKRKYGPAASIFRF